MEGLSSNCVMEDCSNGAVGPAHNPGILHGPAIGAEGGDAAIVGNGFSPEGGGGSGYFVLYQQRDTRVTDPFLESCQHRLRVLKTECGDLARCIIVRRSRRMPASEFVDTADKCWLLKTDVYYRRFIGGKGGSPISDSTFARCRESAIEVFIFL